MPTVSRGLYNWLFQRVAVLEDFADRLSHVWTFGLLLIFAAAISWKQEFHQPIRCITPIEFSDTMNAYVHEACWSMHQHYTPVAGELIPVEPDLRLTGWKYKWLPVILVIQALLFKFPNIIMHVLHGYSGISFEKIAGFTKGFQNLNLSERSQLGQQIGHYLYFWCKQWVSLPWRGMTIVWFLVKTLFCVNAVTQLVLVDKFLSTRNPPFDNSTSYGDTIYSNLFDKNATEWKPSPPFPRILLCDYQVQLLTNIQRYTVQCVLPVSEFNEYVYMLIWIWLLIVCLISWLSYVGWLVLTLLPIPRQRYISKMLNLTGEESKLTRNNADKLTGLVGEDGVNVLKLVSSNSSELLVRDAVWSMLNMSQRQTPYGYDPVMTHPPSAPDTAVQPEAEMDGAQAPGKVLHVS